MLLPAWRQHTLTSIAHLQVVTLRKFTTHVEIRKILPEYGHIFFPLYVTSNLRIYSWKIFLQRWVDLAGSICCWWANVCKLQYSNFYPYYSAYISVTISLSVCLTMSPANHSLVNNVRNKNKNFSMSFLFFFSIKIICKIQKIVFRKTLLTYSNKLSSEQTRTNIYDNCLPYLMYSTEM